MKKKKIFLVCIVLVTTLTFFLRMNISTATDDVLYIQRTAVTPGHYGYSINNITNSASGGAQTIWNLLKMKDSSTNEYYAKGDNNYLSLYCLDITKWMGNLGSNETNSNTVVYNGKYNMDLNKDDILAKYPLLGAINNEVNNYDALIWLLDNIYNPYDAYYAEDKASEKEEDKLALLEAAGITKEYDEEYGDYYYSYTSNEGTYREIYDSEHFITDDDIEAVQQAILWRYTLSESSEDIAKDILKFDTSEKSLMLFYTVSGQEYNSLSSIKYGNNNGTGIAARDEQAVLLYNYLTQKADEAGKNGYTSIKNSSVTFNTNGLEKTQDEKYILNINKTNKGYVVGPISITGTNIDPMNIDIKVTDNSSTDIAYNFTDSQGNVLENNPTIKQLVNQGDFYITIQEQPRNGLNININTKAKNVLKTLWYNTEHDDYQPIVNPTIDILRNNITYTVVKDYKFDLKLIKRIVEVNGVKVPERIENVDITNLANGTETTADYILDKNPVSVMQGDIVKYTLRIYNEGDIDGYASEISEDIPAGLEFIWSEKTEDEINEDTTLSAKEKEAMIYNQGIWDIKTVNKDTNKVESITTDYLAKGKGEEIATDGANLIKAFDSSKVYTNTINDKNPDYREVSVYLKVTAENSTKEIIRNEAAITKDTDKDGNSVDDRDSDTENWKKENSNKYYDQDKKWPIYEEDDEDYDNIKLQSFDLALRKFIIAVSDNTEIEDEEYLKESNGTYTRVPQVDTSKLNTIGEDGKIITTAIYNHTKEPVEVKRNDYVIYMLRVYNEGDLAGYASEIKDHLPSYLEYVDSEFNEKYGWEVSEDGRTVTTTYLSNHLINATTINEEGTIVLSYKEVPIMCKVKETAVSVENITNIADITEYKDENKNKITDRDSRPDNVVLPVDSELPVYKENETGSYIPGQQDDDDFEKVVVRTFDLALRKWVTHAIIVEDEKETITATGHKAEDDPEQVVKVEIDRNKLSKLTVKFKYSIKITNEGDVAGYAKEITDYVPEGLKFVAEDNKNWTDEGNNVISTRQLENKLLQPGESTEIEVILRWINGKDNLGLKTNIAEISEDYNDKHLKDIDSTPDNKVSGEDDIDDAPVLLSITTGQTRIYFTLGFIVLITLATGIILINKFVL